MVLLPISWGCLSLRCVNVTMPFLEVLHEGSDMEGLHIGELADAVCVAPPRGAPGGVQVRLPSAFRNRLLYLGVKKQNTDRPPPAAR